VAAAELADAGRKVIVVDQEPEGAMGGQVFWSLGGLMFVDSPEQRRMRITDSRELALQDWMGTAGFDRPEDEWPRRWAEAYVDFAAGSGEHTHRDRGLRAGGPGRDRHQRGHRRQPRARAGEVARATGKAPCPDALRRACARGRADVGDRP